MCYVPMGRSDAMLLMLKKSSKIFQHKPPTVHAATTNTIENTLKMAPLEIWEVFVVHQHTQKHIASFWRLR